MNKLSIAALTIITASFSIVSYAGNGASVQHTVDDYACVVADADENGDIVSRCGDYDGVLHITSTPSGNEIGIFNGAREDVIYLNGEPVSEQYEQGHIVLVDSDGDGEWNVQRSDLCRTFIGRFGELVSIDSTVMIVNGELIMRDLERVDSCE